MLVVIMYAILTDCFILYFICFFFNDTATTEIYTLSLHDALPISVAAHHRQPALHADGVASDLLKVGVNFLRSEEHTSELQSHLNLVCRLLLEKKKSGTVQQGF